MQYIEAVQPRSARSSCISWTLGLDIRTEYVLSLSVFGVGYLLFYVLVIIELLQYVKDSI